jgi:hypothetical protein
MNPALDDSSGKWKCSKLSRNVIQNSTRKTYTFNLLWIAPSHAMSGYKPTKNKGYTKEICRTYATEEECLEGINNFTI